MGNLHWPVYNESHHDVHVSDVLLQVWIRQIQLCGPVGNITTKTLFPASKMCELKSKNRRKSSHGEDEACVQKVKDSRQISHLSIVFLVVYKCITPSTILQP